MIDNSVSADNSLFIHGAMLSDRGTIRADNEDKVMFSKQSASNGAYDTRFVALVADGMGGHKAGDIASNLASDIIRRIVLEDTITPIPETLKKAIFTADQSLRSYSLDHPDTTGMGTTCTIAVIENGMLWCGHVGDSRLYIIRKNVIAQITSDHSLHAKLIADGVINIDDSSNQNGKNILLQAIGVGEELRPDISKKAFSLKVGDFIILSTDGLHNYVSSDDLITATIRYPPLEACRFLIDLAIASGSDDNASVGIFTVIDQQVSPQKTGEDTNVIVIDQRS